MGELKSREFIFHQENSLEWTIEGLYVDFTRMQTLTLEPEIAYSGYLKYQELSFDNENSLRSRIEVLQVDFSKCVNFMP